VADDGKKLSEVSFIEVLLTLESNALAAMSALMAGVMLSVAVDVHACSNGNRAEGCCCSC
jgi:hypothetical protein